MQPRPARPKEEVEPCWDGIDPAVRAAYERRAAELAAWRADPVAQANLASALEKIRNASPPWEQEGWVPTPPPDAPPGELLRRMRERLGRLDVTFRWLDVSNRTKKKEPEEALGAMNLKKLKAARKKALDLAAVVRSDAFEDWVDKFVVEAERPDEWTRARVLYENYLQRTKDYGWNRPDKPVVKEELATETQWGKMMGSRFAKKRRRNGWYYPLRLKQGA